MALPTSGPLSFSAIANELGTPLSNVSLREMSNSAGFSIPDTVSDFYGYGPSGDLILFFISSPLNDPSKVCEVRPSCCTAVWHNGVNSLPVIGDIVYEDASGTTPLLPFKEDVFFGMNEFECEIALSWFKLSSEGDGQVIDIGFCKKK
jgi:hypothetical protein